MSVRQKKIRLALAVSAVALIAVGLIRGLGIDVSSSARDVLTFFREAGPVPFFIAMALLPAVGFPLSAFTVVAGPVFVPTLGLTQVIIYTVAATTANVAIAYWVASRGLRPWIARGLRVFGYSLPMIQPQNAWTVVLLVRIVPGPPFFLQSFLLALGNAPFRIYMIISTVVPASYLTLTIVGGDALMRKDFTALAVAAGFFLLVGAGLHFLRKRLTPARAQGLSSAADPRPRPDQPGLQLAGEVDKTPEGHSGIPAL